MSTGISSKDLILEGALSREILNPSLQFDSLGGAT